MFLQLNNSVGPVLVDVVKVKAFYRETKDGGTFVWFGDKDWIKVKETPEEIEVKINEAGSYVPKNPGRVVVCRPEVVGTPYPVDQACTGIVQPLRVFDPPVDAPGDADSEGVRLDPVVPNQDDLPL